MRHIDASNLKLYVVYLKFKYNCLVFLFVKSGNSMQQARRILFSDGKFEKEAAVRH